MTRAALGHNDVCLPVGRDVRGDHVDQNDWLEELVAEVHARHPTFRRVTVERLVARLAERYRRAPVQDFVPVLVRREALDQLSYAETIVPAEAHPSRNEDSLLPA
jgi:hypothetical protein